MFALTFILLMDQLFRLLDLLVRKGLSIEIVGQILVYHLPLIVSYTAPMAILVAIVMTFGRFAHDNEILALKTSGLTFLSIMRMPVFLILLFSIFLIFFNNYVLPESNHRLRNLMMDVSRKRPAIRLPEGVFNDDFPGYTIYIGRKDERRSKLYDITIYDKRNNLMMTAPHGELRDLEEQNIIQFTLHDGELHQLIDKNKYQRTKFARQIVNMTVNADLVHKERTYRDQNELNVAGLKMKISATQSEVRQIRSEIAGIGINALDLYLRGERVNLGEERFKIEKRLQAIKSKSRKISRYLIELNKKFSLAVACLLFVFIGAPLGYISKKGGIAGILIGVLLFSLFYILILAGEEFADRRGFSPFWAMWLPNIILLVSGCYALFIAEFEKSPLRRLFR